MLELAKPGARCTGCGFGNSIAGQRCVEAGRLIYRADEAPLEARGPDFTHCGECGAGLSGITVEWGQDPLSRSEVAELRATERAWQDEEERGEQ